MVLLLLFFPLFTWAQTFPGHNIKINAEDIRFTHQSFGSKVNTACGHSIESSASQDWKVICGAKTFRVHLWVTVYQRSVEPETSFEVLYWVSEKSGGLGGDATVWFNMKKSSELHSLTISQNVDQNSAGLYLDLKVQP